MLGEEAGAALAGVLKITATLTELNLVGNKLGDKAGVALAGALETNATITWLYLEDNKIGKEFEDGIEAACKRNRAHISNVGAD